MDDETQMEHEYKLKVVDARKEAFKQDPVRFTIWDISIKSIDCLFWLGVIFLVAQCSCGGCM